MKVKEMIAILKKCNPEHSLKLIHSEELECMPEWWDEDKEIVGGDATKVFSQESHSHEFYLLAIKN